MIGSHLDLYSTTYEKAVFLGDFNVDIKELQSLIKQATCSKNTDSETCIDLLITNANTPQSFSTNAKVHVS